MKKIFIIIVSLTIVLYTKAQSIPKLQDPTNQFIIDRAIDIDTSGGVIYYKVDSLKPTQLFTTYFSSTGLGALDVMVKVNTTKDSILADEDSPEPNLYHDVYKQYYNGILVEGSDYTIHHDGENVWSSSGFIVEGLNLSVIPEINESTALNYATSHIGCESYDWDSTGNNPVGTLVLLPVGDEEVYNASNYKLVWKFTLVGFNPSYNKTIYINANTGAALAEHNNVHDGSFNHIYYGTKYDLDTRKKQEIGLPLTNGIYTQMMILGIYLPLMKMALSLITIDIKRNSIMSRNGIGMICSIAMVMMFGPMTIGVQQQLIIVHKKHGIITNKQP